MLKELFLPSRVFLARRYILTAGVSSVEMPGKRKADVDTKDEGKKNKGATDWDSLDFGSSSKTAEKKVRSSFRAQFID